MPAEFTKVICRSHRELDALVAEKLMGWHRQKMGLDEYLYPLPNFSLGACEYWEPIKGQHLAVAEFLPHYSTDMTAAWEVVIQESELLFSKRRQFCEMLQHQTQNMSITGRTLYINWPDLLFHITPVTICIAGLATQDIEVELAL